MILYLLNDVATKLNEPEFIVGVSDVEISKEGESQANDIGKNIQKYLNNVRLMISSDMLRIKGLIHHVRINSNNKWLTKIDVQIKNWFNERDFGVLNGSKIKLSSDIFKNTRILPEKGESVSQTRKRGMSGIEYITKIDVNTIVFSHTFMCQILFNSLLGINHSMLTGFWIKKGSLAIIESKSYSYGVVWTFKKAINLIEQKEYSLDEIKNGEV